MALQPLGEVMNKVFQLKPREVLQQSGLCQNVIVCVICRGTIAVSPLRADISSELASIGIVRARQLGVTLDAVGEKARFKYIVAAADTGSKKTAKEAFHGYGGTPWMEGTGRQLYAPENDADFNAMRKTMDEAAAQAEIHAFPPNQLYKKCKELDSTGFFNRFMDESRQMLYALPGIAGANRIAIVSHRVMCNAIVEALFPQHAAMLENTRLGPGDLFMASSKDCRYFPLMPPA